MKTARQHGRRFLWDENNTPVIIVLLYFLASLLFEVISNPLLSAIADSPEHLLEIRTLRTLVFIVVSTFGLFLAIRITLQKIASYNQNLLRTEKALNSQSELLAMTSKIGKIGGWEFDPATGEGTWTDEVARIHDMSPSDKTSVTKGLSVYRGEYLRLIEKAIKEAVEHGTSYDLELEMVTPVGNHKWVRTIGSPVIENGSVKKVRGTFTDITMQKQAELERETSIEFLRLISETGETRELIHRALVFFQAQSGCEAVGIRLNKDGDYPYYEVQGFDKKFVETESSLCQLDEDGNIIRDSSGDPSLECMCGNIIRGRFDPSKPFFTPGGSFWAHSTTRLLATTTDADRQAKTRNHCNSEGYESVALIPLKQGGECLGLLQLNDRHQDMFSAETITFWERLAGYLAVALSERLAEEAALKSQQSYQSLFENMINGFAYCRMIYEDEEPVDFKYLHVNNAFSRITGLKDVQGKQASEVIPGIKKANRELLHLYARVAETGKPERFEFYLPQLDAWFDNSVYGLEKGSFVTILDNITSRKKYEEKIMRLNQVLRAVRNTNQLITRENDRQILLDSACQNLIETRGYEKCWIAVLGDNEQITDYAEAASAMQTRRRARRPIGYPRAQYRPYVKKRW
jgi:PAS domain-containing protein